MMQDDRRMTDTQRDYQVNMVVRMWFLIDTNDGVQNATLSPR